MSCTPQNDDLVKEIVLLNKRPFYLHGYFAPFLFAYAIGAYFWKEYFGIDQQEIGIIIAVSIAFIQLLTILFCLWSVDVRCFLMYTKVNSPNLARYAKVTPTSHNGSKELLRLKKQATDDIVTKTWIDFQKVIYVYDYEEKKCFLPVQFPVQETFHHYQSSKGFLTESDYEASLLLYGNNEMEMVIPDFKELFIERASAPFFVFQVFCVALWCLDEYWYYSLFTLFMLVAFEASLVYQQLRNMAEIRKMGNKQYTLYVYRFKKWKYVRSSQLVVGDIVSITRSPTGVGEERTIPCDILLLRGRVIVDEAMLTGESIPQMKDPIDSLHGDTELDLSAHSRVHVISGGTRVVQHDAPARRGSWSNQDLVVSRPPDNGCVGYVLQTGFNTSQGKLLRTILFGVKRVTANNMETFAFIMFLLIFAIAASAYVWVVGSEDPKRSRYKLVLNCVLILTSVVPPELPIELSLAVNSSLLALSKLYVYCTEPFRIPFAGKIDICCFDKTGTLTSDRLVVEGIAGIKSPNKSNSAEDASEDNELCAVKDSPAETQTALATCHSLVKIDRELVGDPLEQAMLKAVEWDLSKNDAMVPKRRGSDVQVSKIVQRFHFSSALKRMSVIISQEELGQMKLNYFVSVKGAAEVLKEMYVSFPIDYDDVHQDLSRRGARVLALGFRSLGRLTTDEVTMITGDNPLTACHVGKVLKFCSNDICLILTEDVTGINWKWLSVDGLTQVEVDLTDWKKLATSGYDLCMTGDGFAYLQSTHKHYLDRILPSIRIFARVSPKQKEEVITSLKQLGFVVLMCGDGTNDVGALKHAHVGVALLSNAPEIVEKKSKLSKDDIEETKNDVGASGSKLDLPRGSRRRLASRMTTDRRLAGSFALKSQLQSQQEDLARRRQTLQKMVNDMEHDPQIVKMGDASIAAPFSYKLSSILAICHIIKQGRCTLVTTLQMFKILALNALILAYSQSVLFLDGVKFSDGQATLQGLLLAGCFLFISRSKPLKVLSKERPLPNIFNVYTILTITLQFAVHFSALIFLVQEAKRRDPKKVDFEADFEANLLNSSVYVLSLATQIITFAINYRGHPFMESLTENKALLYSLLASSFFLVNLVLGMSPELNKYFEVVIFENEVCFLIVQVLVAVLVSSWLIDRSLRFLLGAGRLRKLT